LQAAVDRDTGRRNFASAPSAPMPPFDFAALVFLVLPLVVFFAGFIVWLIALPALAVIAASLWRLRPQRIAIGRADIRQGLMVALAALVFLWACAYLPPFGKTWDWIKHFALINELARYPWPPVNDETHTYLRYSLAYHLLPGLAARLFGELAIEPAVFLETWTGLWLILMLALTKIRPLRPPLFVATFLYFGGLTLVPWLLAGAKGGVFDTKEWWAGNSLFAYESHVTLFLWVPQHALPGLIGVLLLLPAEGREPEPASFGLLGAAALLWSPFAFLGLLPFALAAVKQGWAKTVRDPSNILCALLLVLPVAVYLSAGAESVPHGFNWDRPGFSFRLYAEFVLLHVGVFLIALAFCDWKHLRYPAIVIVVLLALPLFRIGAFNDFTMRTCIPAIGLLAIAVASALSEARNFRALPLAVLCVVGAAGAVIEIGAADRGERLQPALQSMRTGFLRDDRRFFVQYNAPLPNWILR
jgi:hypothetical protein